MQGRGQVGQGGVVTRAGGHTGTLDLSLLLITGLVTIGYLILNMNQIENVTRVPKNFCSYLDFLTQRR